MPERIVPGNPKPLTNADLLAALADYATLVYVGATFAPISHSHGNITNDGRIGTTANLPLITTTGGAVTVGSFGTTANTFCQGNDSRLSDARTPLAHNQAWSTITSTPTTLSGYGITDAQSLDSDLTAIAALSGTGFAQRTGTNTWALNTSVARTDVSNVFSAPQIISGRLEFATDITPTVSFPFSCIMHSSRFLWYAEGGAVGDALILNVRSAQTADGSSMVSLYGQSNGNNAFQTGLRIATTYNQSGTASSADLLINRTDVAIGSGNQRMVDARVNNTTRFFVNRGGDMWALGTLTGSAVFAGTYTVGTLPNVTAFAGAFAQVTDSNSTTNGNTVAGGGANRVPVFSNGTNWIIK